MSRIAVFFLLVITPALAVLLALLGILTMPNNLVGWFLLLTGAIYSAGLVIVYRIRRKRFWESGRSESTTQEEHGDRSFWLITLAMMSVFFLSPLEYLFLSPSFTRNSCMQYSGIGLIIFGSALFVWARHTLGANYSGHASVKKGQELVRSGPYHYIRHPAYAGYLLMAFGISIGYSSLVGLVATLVLLLPSLFYRIKLEEQLLSDHFGEVYRHYVNATKRLIPSVW